ncbi:MAG TPA: FecR family protein [Polyangiales bacterium]|nr:FecR family protein [Polyangiales bacterium]
MSERPRALRELLREPATPARKDAVWRQIEERRSAGGGSRSQRRLALAGLIASTAVVIAYVALRHGASPARELARGPAMPAAPASLPGKAEPAQPPGAMPVALRLASGEPLGAYHVAETADARKLALSDGTEIELEPGADLLTLGSSPERLLLRLSAGRASFHVSPQGARHFDVVSDGLAVSVVGTRFSVAVTPELVRVEVQEGTVRARDVSGHGDPAKEQALTAGQHFEVRRGEPVQPARPSAADGGGQRAAAHDAAAKGDFTRAYALLGENGFDGAVRDAKSTEQLLLLADTARLTGHPQKAQLALTDLVRRFPKDPRASIAELTLARMQLDQLRDAAAAASAFEKAIAMGLPAGLAEDAYARRVEALAKAGRKPAARSAADDYEKHFPAGRRLQSVRKWAAAP